MSEFAAQVQCHCAVDTEGHLWSPADGCTRSPVPEPAAPAAEVGGNAVAVEDIRQILAALGLGTHARPYSAHDVVQREVLPALQRLVAEVAEARRLREQLREVEAELRELASAALRSGKH